MTVSFLFRRLKLAFSWHPRERYLNLWICRSFMATKIPEPNTKKLNILRIHNPNYTVQQGASTRNVHNPSQDCCCTAETASTISVSFHFREKLQLRVNITENSVSLTTSPLLLKRPSKLSELLQQCMAIHFVKVKVGKSFFPLVLRSRSRNFIIWGFHKTTTYVWSSFCFFSLVDNVTNFKSYTVPVILFVELTKPKFLQKFVCYKKSCRRRRF
jgi:hypothetical protein